MNKKFEEEGEKQSIKDKEIYKTFNKKIDEIYSTHLLRDNLIGDGPQCLSKTLIDYAMVKVPENEKKIA